MAPDREYQPLVTIPNEDGRLKEGTLVLSARFLPSSYEDILLVSEIRRKDELVDWHAAMLNRQIENTGEWNTVFYYRNLYDLGRDDVVRVYLWNQEDAGFLIDEINVDIYPL